MFMTLWKIHYNVLLSTMKKDDVREWLRAQGKTKATIKGTVNHAEKYGHVLD